MEIYRNESNNIHREHGPAVVTRQMVQYVVNGRLHRADGPAVVTANGTKRYYWKGVHIEPSLWNSKNTISIAEVLAIANVEIRRCMVEIIGYAELIKRGDDKINVLDKDRTTGAVLYKLDMPEGDEAVVVVKVLDGTPLKDEKGVEYRKEYFLRVPPTTTSCKEAIAWTFDMEPEEYSWLEKET